ncbi:hypothetical protein MASR2M78_31100 [Treponema sp.]
MPKHPPAVYEPGELDRVRQKLGNLDKAEARRMASLLGGQIGVEKGAEPPVRERHRSTREETVDVSIGGRGPSSRSTPRRRVEVLETETPRRNKAKAQAEKNSQKSTEDDPSVPVSANYRERVRMDRYAAQPEFEIKNSTQVLVSMISIFGDPPDLLNSAFSTRRINEYYTRLENMVTATRSLLPRNNIARIERFKAADPFAYSILETIRAWDIERISAELARIQSHPRESSVADFSAILKAVYRPIYILENLDSETQVREAYRTLYQMLFEENPAEAKEKHQGLIRASLASYVMVMKSVRYLLYPLLMKLLSDRWFSYEEFFTERRRRIAAFLDVTEANRLRSPLKSAEGLEEKAEKKSDPSTALPTQDTESTPKALVSVEPETVPARELPRSLTRGLDSLEALFPEAGWTKLAEFPDLLPYFIDVFDFNKGFELVAPEDPLQQIIILMHILEELFYGLRYVAFGTITGSDGEHVRADDAITKIISGWHDFIERTLGKEYLPRLSEYTRVMDGSSESRTSVYSKRIQAELNWIKRLDFLPYIHFESVNAPNFRHADTEPFYIQVRELKRLLTQVASGIEAGTKLGGAAKGASCEGIDNPWDPYIFQVPNPVSIRLDAILGGKHSKKRTNAALVFFSLSAATVIDYLINNEASWAYAEEPGAPFRSLGGEGIKPVFGIDVRLDADLIFRRVMKEKAAAAARQRADQASSSTLGADA